MLKSRRRDLQIHFADFEPTAFQLVIALNRGFAKIQDLHMSEKTNGSGKPSISPGQSFWPLGLPKLRVPTGQLFFDRHDGDGDLSVRVVRNAGHNSRMLPL